MAGKTSVMFDAGESLFLRSGKDHAVLYERGSAVMVIGGYAENTCGNDTPPATRYQLDDFRTTFAGPFVRPVTAAWLFP